ncbi:MAG: SDR family oxidoreductase [Candidatus Hydrogenedentota bacterium]
MQLEGNTALITGAGRGIGRGIALAFAKEGAKIAGVARSDKELTETARLVHETGADAVVFPCDVTSPESVRAAVAGAHEALGPIDLLVNNAGFARFKPFHEYTFAEWQQTFAVNLDGVFHMVQAVLPDMMARKTGRIINISSVAGLKPLLHQSAYVAAKHALNGLTEVLAMELKEHNIGVHAICPGGVDTRLSREAMPERDKSHWMTPEDIAHAALYLATMSPRMTTDILPVRRFGSVPVGG